MNEPKRHHYIPQFILRNFAYDDCNKIHYFDLKTKTLMNLKTTEVFMQSNLYRDEINHADSPTQLETDFSLFEQEVSKAIKKCLNNNPVLLSYKEYDSLLLFLSLMGFRSANTFNKTFNKKDDSSFYSFWQADGDLSDFWKRNLEFLVKCRSIEEVISNPNIDKPIKLFLLRDSNGITGKYITIMEKRGPIDFVISDSYPVVITGDFLNLPLYDYYPISPNRIIVFCSNGVENVPLSASVFNNSNLKHPKISRDGETIEIKVTKIYEQLVSTINYDIIKNATNGYILTERNLEFFKSNY